MYNILTKKCSKCGEEKLATNEFFHTARKEKSGFASSCKICHKAHYDSTKVLIGRKKKEDITYLNTEGLTKVCTGCKIEKSATLEFFNKQKCAMYGLRSTCKECRVIERLENRDAIKETAKSYRENNRDKLKEAKARYYKENFDKIKEQKSAIEVRERENAWTRNDRVLNPDKYKEYSKRGYEKNKEVILLRNKESRERRKEKIKVQKAIYAKENRCKIRQYINNKRNSDPNYKIRHNVSSRLLLALKAQNAKKNTMTTELLGCSIPELRIYLENLFLEGMSWDNLSHNGWHIDHKLPVAAFDLTDPVQQKQCFHYTNLQPMWASDNMSKGCKVLEPMQLKMIL